MNILPGFGQFLTKEELANALRSFAAEVERGASFEGSVGWEIPETVPEEHADRQVFEVIAAVRHGNDMGQGGMWLIRDHPRESEARRVATPVREALADGQERDVPELASRTDEEPSKVRDALTWLQQHGELDITFAYPHPNERYRRAR